MVPDTKSGGVPAIKRQVARLAGRPALVTLAVYTLLAVWLFGHAWASPTRTWVGNAGDPPKFMWLLRWTPYALAHAMNPFFTHHINSGNGINLLWDTSIPLPSLVLTPVTLIFGPIVAFNVASTAAVALSAWCAYLCFRRYARSHVAAAIGGLLYGFSPYAMAHALGGHLNLSLAFTPPLLLLLLDEILVRQRRRAGVLGVALGGLAAAQLLIGQELLATEALAAIVGVAALVIVFPREVRAHAPFAAQAIGVALGFFLLLAAVPILFALYSSRRPTHGTVWGHEIFSSDVTGFVVPTSLQQFRLSWTMSVASHYTDSCCPADSQSYIGLPLIALLAVTAITRWSNKLVRVITIVAVSMLVFSLGPHLHVNGHVTSIPMPATWLSSVPLIPNMLASRLMLYVYLCAGLLVTIFLDGVWRRDRPAPRGQLEFPGMPQRRFSRSAFAWTAFVVLALAFLFPRIPFPASHATTPSFFSSDAIKAVPDGSVALVAPFARDTDTSEPMLWQAVAGMRFRMPEGYALGPDVTGRFSFLPVPTLLSQLMQTIELGHNPPSMDAALRTELLDELRSKHVKTVIVGPFSQHDHMVQFFTSLLDARPDHIAGVDVWWNVYGR